MSQIIINGEIFSGKNISINNGQIILDGKKIEINDDSKKINIKIEGNIDFLNVDCCDNIEVLGNVQNLNTKSGDVNVKGDIKGSIQTSSGDIECNNVSGSISTKSGDIKYKK